MLVHHMNSSPWRLKDLVGFFCYQVNFNHIVKVNLLMFNNNQIFPCGLRVFVVATFVAYAVEYVCCVNHYVSLLVYELEIYTFVSDSEHS